MNPPTAAAKNYQDQFPQLRAFLLTTSIKGLPRLAKARHPLFRALWSLCVLLGSAVTLYLVTRLFLQYEAHSVTTTITENRDTSLAFPAITLCNLNPLANTNITQGQVDTYMDSARTMASIKDFHEGPLFDPAILFANVAMYLNNASARQFLVTCQWNIQQGEVELCRNEDAHMFVYRASLGYCFTLKPPGTVGFVTGFSAILHLDDSFEFDIPFYRLTLNTPLSLGAILFVHHRKALPDLLNGVVLLAGRNSHVYIHVQQRIRQPSPYSRCTDLRKLPQAPEYSYTQQTCLDLCLQTTLISSCGCISSQALHVPTLKRYNGEPLCGVFNQNNLTLAVETFLKEQRCIGEMQLDPDPCHQQCNGACEEDRYVQTTESTIWPHTSLRWAFWREYIMNSTYSHKFDDMSPRLNDTLAMRSWKRGQIKNGDLLSNNFLQVSYTIESCFYVFPITMYALHSWAKPISSIGREHVMNPVRFITLLINYMFARILFTLLFIYYLHRFKFPYRQQWYNSCATSHHSLQRL